MAGILIYGKEHTFLDAETGLLFRCSGIHETAPLHTHTFYEIFIVCSGTALHLVNHAIQTVNEGDLLFIRPSDTHTYEFYCSENFRIVNVGFSEQLFCEIRLFLENRDEMCDLLKTELPVCVHTKRQEQDYIVGRLLEIGELLKAHCAKKTALFAKCCLADIFARFFFTYIKDTTVTKTPSWFQAMLREMQKIDNLRIGYGAMSELSPCSQNHLCRVFKSILSVTPTEYINTKRLEYAVYLLTQTDKEIIEIADYCGFSSLSHFYHMFQEKYRISPAKFRKAHSS